MSIPEISQADLQRVHAAMHITVPLDQASPMLLTTLAVVAHCWLKKQERKQPYTRSEKTPQRPRRRTKTHDLPDEQQLSIDLKRRASGDFD